MKDEQGKLLDRLFLTARATKPDTAAVEKNFETRLMASIEERRNSRVLWSFWVWRLVPLFSLIVIIVGIGDIVIDPDRSNDLSALFTSGYEENLTTTLLGGG
jgi:hypothetical protein